MLEWSPQGVRIFDPSSKKIYSGERIADVLSLAGSPRLVGLALSRRIALVRTVRLPNISKADAFPALRMQLDRFFPIPSSELAYDFAFHSDVSAEGREALVCAVKADLLRQAMAELRAEGVRAHWCAPVAVGAENLARDLGAVDAVVVEETVDGLGLDAIRNGELVYSRAAHHVESLVVEAARTKAAAEIEQAEVLGAANLSAPGISRPCGLGILEELSERGPAGVNLRLPEDIAADSRKVDAKRRNRALLLCLVAAVAGLYAYDSYDQKASVVRAEEAKYRSKRAQPEKRLAKLASDVSSTEGRADVLRQAFEPAQRTSDILTIIGNAAPAGVWLTGITFERGKQVQIRGNAKTNQQVAAYVDALSAESRLRGVTLVFSNNGKIDDAPVLQFSITAMPVGNLPVIEKETKTSRPAPTIKASAGEGS